MNVMPYLSSHYFFKRLRCNTEIKQYYISDRLMYKQIYRTPIRAHNVCEKKIGKELVTLKTYRREIT